MLSGAAGTDAQPLSATVSISRERAAGRCECFAKIQRLAKLRDRFLSLAYGGDVGRSAQPSREQLFAEVRAGARKQLEERGMPEDIEVARVQMIFGKEALSRCPDAVPCIFESRYAMVIECDGSTDAIQGANDAIMPCGERGEGRNRQHEQPGRGSGCQHEPTRQRERSNGAEARVADTRVEAGEARMFGCARRPPVAIFV